MAYSPCTVALLLALTPALGALGVDPAPPKAKPIAEVEAPDGARKLFPYIRIHTQERWLEFDGFVPIDVNDPDAPHVYLEQVACGRESAEIPAGKEHESLVATSAKGSHIHAGLMLLGHEPGAPVRWSTAEDGSIISHPPTGPKVAIELRWKDKDGQHHVHSPQEWIRHVETGEPFADGNWVFSGSLFVTFRNTEVYDADRSGTLIGLASFGTEVLSWMKPIHHESGIEQPVWIARNEIVPEFRTLVTVRIVLLDEAADETGESTDGAADSDQSRNPD